MSTIAFNTPTPTTPTIVKRPTKRWVVTRNGKRVFGDPDYETARGYLDTQLRHDKSSTFTLTHGNTHKQFDY